MARRHIMGSARGLGWTGLGLVSAGLLHSSPAAACGGFFCAQQPVAQTSEQIIFSVDHDADTVQVDIQIGYQGLAEDFAWIVPLTSAPIEVETGSARAFQVLERATRPQFRLRRVQHGQCFVPPSGGLDSGWPVSDSAAQVPVDPPEPPPVTVLRRSNVGPYDSVVLTGTNPDEVRRWLQDNGFRVTDTMMESVVPYLAKGDVLLALKLLKDGDVGELQPISVTLPGSELCIPLRLTAIAAQDDMDVTAYVFSDRGRAVSTNYLHFELNHARIDWRRGGRNYRQLVAEAADEAGGRAFLTEYAAPTARMSALLNSFGDLRLDQLVLRSNLLSFLEFARQQGITARSEFQGIMRRFVTDEGLLAAGIVPERFWRCPECFTEAVEAHAPFNSPQFDARSIVDVIRERIEAPERRMQDMLQDRRYMTRLYTLISPDEMTADPVFDYNAALPDVRNIHTATEVTICRQGRVIERRLELDDGTILSVDTRTGETMVPPSMPATDVVLNPVSGAVLVDNREVSTSPRALPSPVSPSCGCEARPGGRTTSNGGVMWMLLAPWLMVVARRRRR